MTLKVRLLLALGGLIISILIVSGAGSIATSDLAMRIETLDQAAALGRHLDRIERAQRQYQASRTGDDLEATRALIAEASHEIAKLQTMSEETGDQIFLIRRLDDSFARYRELLNAYAESEARRTAAQARMTLQLNNLKVMAIQLKEEKESDYHRSFALANSIQEAEDRLKVTLRLTALANELIVVQTSIERAVALFQAGDRLGSANIPIEIGRIAEIADRIRHIERVSADYVGDGATPNLPDRLASRSNHFQAGFDDFRLAMRDQTRRADDMAGVALEVTELIQKINTLQTKAAVQKSEATLALSLLGVMTALVLGVLAVVVIRSRIIAPLTAITGTMRRMSGGQLELVVPCQERRDELGAVANALEVFRQNSLEARRLAEENVEVERRLAKEKADAAFLEQSLEKEKDLNAQQRRFVSLVSHEFRTPLAIIDGRAQRMIRRGDRMEVEERNATLEKMRSAVRRLTDLMESVLSSASLEAGSIAFNPMPVDLRALVEKACESQQEISSQHKIDVDVSALPEDYLGDPKLLYQVVSNLLSNAVKYSPEADHVHVAGRLTDNGLEIAVRDFGIGIPEDELPNICQRFFRASTSSGIQGTGIGLNLVKALVEMHGGVMDITSIEGQGSTFIVKLPLELPADTSKSMAA